MPVFKDPYYYYSRTVKGLQYNIKCRKLKSMDAVEEVLLDLNKMTQHEYMDLGVFDVSPNHNFAIYSLDLDGSELYSIYFKNLATGELIESEPIKGTGGSVEWFNDNKTIFYNTLDDTHRSFKIWRHVIGSKEPDFLIYHETDDKFTVHPSKSQSEEYIFISSGSSLTSEVMYMSANEPMSQPKVFLPRKFRHEYDVEHQGDRFIITTNGGGQYLNFRLCSCPLVEKQLIFRMIQPKLLGLKSLNMTRIHTLSPPIHSKAILQVFFELTVVYECSSQGYKQIRIIDCKNGVATDSHCIKFNDSVYSVDPASGSALLYKTNLMRFDYNSFTTPQQVWQYDMVSKEKKILKDTEIPGLDPSLYVIERIHAPVPKGTEANAPFDTPVPNAIPISIVYRKDLFKKDGTNALYLYGYGSYGISIDPSWSPNRFSLLDRGIVFAIAHIRGGGDCGRGW